jgi:hypothetical protein
MREKIAALTLAVSAVFFDYGPVGFDGRFLDLSRFLLRAVRAVPWQHF